METIQRGKDTTQTRKRQNQAARVRFQPPQGKF